MTDKIVVLATCGSEEEAGKIARALVDSRLAACVNVVSGVRSTYRWKGAVEDAAEWLLLIKTTRSLFVPLQESIRALHSYEVPEIVALPVVDGLEAYLSWIADSVGPTGQT
jgi:periplasmic divalent cation tolerance protein